MSHDEPDFLIKVGTLLATIRGTPYDANDVAVDPTTISNPRFRMKPRGSAPDGWTIDGAAQVVASTKLEYAWVAGDTDDAGWYHGEFYGTLNGKPVRFPTREYLLIQVTE